MVSSNKPWETEPIAIVGLSCKFAKDASSPEKLWTLLEEGKSAWSEIESSRFNNKGSYNPIREKLTTSHVRGGHFLSEDLAHFDATFFNFSSETAATLDPQFRLQLESVYEALENAGLPLGQVAGSNTSVFGGTFMHDYRDSLIRDEDNLPRFFITGIGSAMASNRISHFFDLRGASMTIDTGCSTTLVALHQAVQNVRNGESSMSIVSGANVLLNPDNFKALGSFGFLSPDGKCFAFDSRANGYGRGEGVATVIIKRLTDAIADGDPIRAVIRESTSNQDGKTETLTSPSQEAQETLMRECYSRAGLDPLDTQYFEAHGTGTAAGDPIEAGAVTAALRTKQRTPAEALRMGSIKTNIGHTEATSGLASVVKVVMAMEKGIIPPTINFEKPNPKLLLDEWRLKVVTELEQWPVSPGKALRASINNFGYGGGNAHVVVEDGEFLIQKLRASNSIQTNGNVNGRINGNLNGHLNGVKHIDQEAPSSQDSKLLLLSGKDEQACERMVSNLKDFLSGRPQDETDEELQAFLQSLIYTLGQRRSLFPWVAAHPVPIKDGIGEVIKALDSPKFRLSRNTRQPRIGMVFTGQGAQWYAMGRELIPAYPVFKASLQTADDYLKELGATWSLMGELHRDAKCTRVNGTGFSIPICVALQISLVLLLQSWGIRPSAVTSHSSGEISAAYTVGAISFREAMGIAYYRSHLTAEMTGSGPVKGGMLAVGLGSEDSERYLDQLTSDAKAVVACVNSPASTTVAGDLPAVQELEALLQGEGIFARRLRVDTAYHSHHMQPIANDYLEAIRKMSTGEETNDHLDSIAYASPVTGYRMSNAKKIAEPEHWVRSLLQPVQFVDAFTEMILGDEDNDSNASSVDLIVEVGPHTALGGPIQQILGLPEFGGLKLPYFGSLVRHNNAVESMQALAASLLREGYPLDMEAINFPSGRDDKVRVLTNLPSYPWNHQTRHWYEPRTSLALRERAFPPHDLLGSLVLGTNPNAPSWRHILRANDSPWVRDHVVQSNMLYPGCGFITLAIEAIRQQLVINDENDDEAKVSGYNLRDVNVLQALVIPDSADGIEIQTHIRPVDDKTIGAHGWKEFEIFSVTADNTWTRHASGLISVDFETQNDSEPKRSLPLSPLTGHTQQVDPRDMWNVLESLGLQYGPTFKNIRSIVQSGKEMRSESTIVVPDTSIPNDLPRNHIIHPGTLDAAAQAAFTALPGTGYRQDSPRVFQGIEKLWISSKISNSAGHSFKCHTSLSHADAQGIVSDVFFVNAESGSTETVLEMEGLTLRTLGRSSMSGNAKPWETDLCSKVEWDWDAHLSPGAHLGVQLNEDEKRSITDLQRVCLYYMQDAVDVLSKSGTDNLTGHHAQVYSWMLDQVQRAALGKLPASPASSEWMNDSPSERHVRINLASQVSVNGRLVSRLGPHLPAILRGEKDPLELLTEDDLLQKYQTENSTRARSVQQAATLLRRFIHKNAQARILEIGASTQNATPSLLKALGTGESGGPLSSLYHFTNVSDDEFEVAREELAVWNDVLAFDTLDVEKDPSTQGFELNSYDLVLATQPLRGSASLTKSLANVRSLVKPGGKLLVIETTRDELDRQLLFSLFPEWWQGKSDEVQTDKNVNLPYPSVDSQSLDQPLKEAGFAGVELDIHDCGGDDLHSTSLILSTVPLTEEPKLPSPNEVVLVTSTKSGLPPPNWLKSLQQSIAAIKPGAQLPAVHLLESATAASYAGKICIFLGEIDRPILRDIDSAGFQAVKALVTSCKGLIWVTRGSAIECDNPDLALSAGFLRVLRNEYLGKPYMSLDLDSDALWWSDEDVSAITQILKVGFSSVASSEPSESPLGEFEYAIRNGNFKIPRVYKDSSRNRNASPEDGADSENPSAVTMEPLYQASRPLSLQAGPFGSLDSLAFSDDASLQAESDSSIAPDLVEFEPRAYGIDVRDIAVVTGQLHDEKQAVECAGIVTRVGSTAAAQGYNIGDCVFSLIQGPIANVGRTEWTNVAHMPTTLSFEEAASLPVAFSTAYTCLADLARLQAGQSVLIHEAADAVGQAAIMVARHFGADIFATVAAPEKRDLLIKKYSIPSEHIFSSQDASFVNGILTATKNRGVDVLLNSLKGPLLQQSCNLVAPFGHFIEIGSHDLRSNSHLDMSPFSRQVSFSAFDLAALMQYKPRELHRVLGEVSKLIEQQIVAPVYPLEARSITDLPAAFQELQEVNHLGKIVLSVGAQDLVPVKSRAPPPKFSPDATYLLVGGVGGIGHAIAYWMATHGAKNLVVLSRSAARSEKAAALIAGLAEMGCRVKAVSCNVSVEADLAKALKACEEDGLPPVRGVIQAAMVLKDTYFEQMSFEDYQTGILPKVHGTWNLHKQFDQAGSLDFFVILSSVVAVTGNASQANYASAGTYQDALARWRVSRGLPAVSIDLGAVKAIGVAAEKAGLLGHLERLGNQLLHEDQVLAILWSAILAPNDPQVVVGLNTGPGGHWKRDSESQLGRDARFAPLRHREAGGQREGAGAANDANSLAAKLAASGSSAEAIEAVGAAIAEKLSDIFMIPTTDIDLTNKPAQYGIDSLVAVELRTMLVQQAGADVSIFSIMQSASLVVLATDAASKSSHVDSALFEA